MSAKMGRNDACFCGSGKKYKKCCLHKEEGAVTNVGEYQLAELGKEVFYTHLLPYFTVLFSKEAIKVMCSNFIPSSVPKGLNVEDFFSNFFLMWILYSWIPSSDMESKILESGKPIALQYLERLPERVNAYQIKFIEKACNTHYSFYLVMEIIAEQVLVVKDILLGDHYKIKDKRATQLFNKSDIIFCQILTLNGQSIFLGISPIAVHPYFYNQIMLLDKKYREESPGKKLTGKLLKEKFESDMIEWLFEVIALQCNPYLDELKNPDGELLALCEAHYQLKVSAEEAIGSLCSLASLKEPSLILKQAEKNESGEVIYVEFPWINEENKLNERKSNAVLGTIIVNKNHLILRTNSEERNKKGIDLLKQHLNEGICFQKTTVESVESMGEKVNGPFRASAEKERNDFLALPLETQQQIKTERWQNWFDVPIPILNNETPRQAAKTQKGRELLEVLFLHYESLYKDKKNLFESDVAYLKEELELV